MDALGFLSDDTKYFSFTYKIKLKYIFVLSPNDFFLPIILQDACFK